MAHSVQECAFTAWRRMIPCNWGQQVPAGSSAAAITFTN
jgi:hypothetical protein